ncbi:MAG: acyloxyacyl hydrolase [Bacteroidia bacterium]|nr:acyloxyacyl hydrolase [Bacteroidia bacterium]
MSVFLAQAQTSHANPERNKIGLFYGFGGQSLEFVKLDLNYQYDIRQIEIQYSYKLFPGRILDFDVLVSPQINLSRYRNEVYDGIEIQGAEWGFAAGIAPSLHSEDQGIAIYLLLSTGPMYITGSPERQSRGINFSSNFMTGINVHVLKNMDLDFRTGFRHLSNANIRYPNGGLNNLIWSVGLNYALR